MNILSLPLAPRLLMQQPSNTRSLMQACVNTRRPCMRGLVQRNGTQVGNAGACRSVDDELWINYAILQAWKHVQGASRH